MTAPKPDPHSGAPTWPALVRSLWRADGPKTVAELAMSTGTSTNTIARQLWLMQEEGLIVEGVRERKDSRGQRLKPSRVWGWSEHV